MNMAVRPLDIIKLDTKADNIYEAIVVMSKRARQINEEMKIEFNQRIEMLPPKMMEEETEPDQPVTNPDQILIARDFEARPKPTETALDEVMADKINFRYKEPEL
jgi:DNA-directed RNA polymerase subunit K/omega